MVAEGYGECVGGVHVMGVLREGEGVLQHLQHLLFSGVATAGDGLLYFAGGILGGLQSVYHGGGYGYALCAAQLEHALHVLAEEGGFNGYCGGTVLEDEGLYLLEDELEALGVVFGAG